MQLPSTVWQLAMIMITCSLFSPRAHAQPQNCSDYAFSTNNSLRFSACNSLPVLNSFLHWNYHASNNTVDIAYRHTAVTDSNWVVWSLNPNSRRMVGAQCLVAYRNSSGQIRAYTSPITDYDTSLPEGPLSFGVSRLSAEYANGQMIIYATLQLPAGRTSFAHVWQHGDVSGDRLLEHSTRGANMRSYGNIDFAGAGSVSGGVSGESGEDSDEDKEKNVHGVLNVVSWGIMMPLGAIMARYLKVFKAANPAWFYLHVTCQTSAYIVGVAGWGTGKKLGGESEGEDADLHGSIGLTLFILGTLQVFALLLRPKPDHKYRFYWNLYHWGTGYAVLALSIFNIFKGLDLLEPEDKWRTAYVGVLIFFGVCVAVLEPFTWYVVLKRKKQERHNKYPPAPNPNGGMYSTPSGTNGNYSYNGHEAAA